MASLDEIMKAFGAFNQGLKQNAIYTGINQARQAVDQVNQQQIGEMEKRQQQEQIAKSLALQMTGMGADGNDIRTAYSTLAPEKIASSADALRIGVMTGDDQVLDFGKKLQTLENEPADDRQNKQFSNQRALQKDAQAHAEKLAMMKLSAAALGTEKAKKDGDIAFDTNVKMAHNYLNKLSGVVGRSGTWESEWLGNSKDAAVMKSVPYQFAVTYTKLVDPNSVAMPGEVKAVQEFLMPFGMSTNKKTLMERLEHLRTTVDEYKQARAAAGGNTVYAPSFSKGEAFVPEKKVAPHPKTGKMTTFQKNRNGTWSPVGE